MAIRKCFSFRLSTFLAFVAGVAVGMWFNAWYGREEYDKTAGWVHYQAYTSRFDSDQVYTSAAGEPLHIQINSADLASSDDLKLRMLTTPGTHLIYEYQVRRLAKRLTHFAYEYPTRGIEIYYVVPPDRQLLTILWSGDLPYAYPYLHGDVELVAEGKARASVTIGTLHVLNADENSITYAFTAVP